MTAGTAPFSIDLRTYETGRLRALLDGTAAELEGGVFSLAADQGVHSVHGEKLWADLNRHSVIAGVAPMQWLPGLDRQGIRIEIARRTKAELKAAEKAEKSAALAAATTALFSAPAAEPPIPAPLPAPASTTPFTTPASTSTTDTEPKTEEVAAEPAVTAEPGPRKRGRPLGSRNRSTLERLACEEAARAAEEAAALEAAAKDSTTATPI